MFPRSPAEQKEEEESGNRYSILWHLKHFQHYHTNSLQTAQSKLQKIDKTATRLVFINNKLCIEKSWYMSNEWEKKLKNFAHGEGFTFIESTKDPQIFNISTSRDKTESKQIEPDDKSKQQTEDKSLYNILWHQNNAYRRYQTKSYKLAIRKYNNINNKSSRLFLINNKVHKHYYQLKNDWKSKIENFAKEEALSITYPNPSINDMMNELKKADGNHSFLRKAMYYGAMSHRDFDCNQPLFEALRCHTRFIEFDVHFQSAQLLVAHDAKHCNKSKTIQSVYLDPLRKVIEEKKLKHPLTLFIDFKSDANKSFNCLQDLIKKEYSDIVRSWKYDGGQVVDGKKKLVNIVVTGNRNIEFNIDDEEERFVSFDGRICDIDRDIYSHEYMPMISDNVKKVIGKKDGFLNDDDKRKLTDYIEKCRKMKKRLRFWGTRDDPIFWQQLIDLDVERDVIVINTDDQTKLIAFLIANGY